MQKEGKLWPADQDRTPRQTRFWDSANPLELTDHDDSAEDVIRIEIFETPEQIENRLKDQFPIYRATKFGKRVLGFERGTLHEI
ncbi:MAG: hypothetical protein M3Q36_04435 [bacterium]|nr:hypothetical protein [bacterium]